MCSRTQLDDGWRASYGNDSRPWLISSVNSDSKQPVSTMKASFTPREIHKESVGPRKELLEKFLIKEMAEKLKEEMGKEPELEERVTEYDGEFQKDGYEPSKINERNEHDLENYEKYPLYYDSVRSIWVDKIDTLNGVTQSSLNAPTTIFRKNSSFTKPITQVLDIPKPGTIGYK